MILLKVYVDFVQPILFMWINAESILLVLRQEPEIAHLAGVYLWWFSFGLPAYAVNAILRWVLLLCKDDSD
jgi:Na+-driven multidrug efflux pump